MKKIFLFLTTVLLSLNLQAKVGLIIPADNRSTAETNAATWFASQYPTGSVIALNAIPSDLSTYTTLWVMVDRNIDEAGFDALFGSAQQTALTAFVKAGGSLLLCKQATRLAYTMGRIGYAPNFATFHDTHDWEDVGRSIFTRMGSGEFLSNQSNHTIYDSDNREEEPLHQYDRDTNARIFLMNRGFITNTNYRYCGWLEVYNKNIQKGGNNDTKEIREAFENDWEATILALRGGINDYCFTDIVLFNDGQATYSAWQGHILAIGSAAYSWEQSECVELTNVKALTTNSVNYLESLAPAPDPCSNCFTITF